jgi:hypothetical protein
MERTREFVSNRLNPWNLAVVQDGRNGIEEFPLAGRSRILILARGEQYAEIEIDTASDIYLVHSSVFYPGWVATVDGHETPIYPAYYALSAIRVPEGNHILRLEYRPFFLAVGLPITALTIFVTLLLLCPPAKRNISKILPRFSKTT